MKEKNKISFSLFWHNLLLFLFIIISITAFGNLFGQSNLLIGVAIVTGFLTYPKLQLKVNPAKMAILLFLFYIHIGIFSKLCLWNIPVGIVLNFSSIYLYLMFTSEPIIQKPFIPLLLCYIFSQGNTVSGHDYVLRLIGLTIGGLLIAIASYITWKKDPSPTEKKSLLEQMNACKQNNHYTLRLAAGITIAMALGAALNLRKPMWISIVVFSITQLEMDHTIERIKHRVGATLLGIVIFCILFQKLIPPQYSFLVILLIGFLGNFFKDYKHQQIIVSISALNAALVLFDAPGAIAIRLLSLFTGIGIVLCTVYLQNSFNTLYQKTVIYIKSHLPKKKEYN